MKSFVSRMKSFFLILFFSLFFFTQFSDAAALEEYSQLDFTKVTGPESIEFDCEGGGPYVGVSDGRILKWEGAELGWKEFAIPSRFRFRKLCDGSTNPNLEHFCGRPLGLKFNLKTCELYVADAYFGLLVVGPHGGVAKRLATSAEGIPFRFTKGLDIDSENGIVYFTDSSTLVQRRNADSLLKSSPDTTGRFLKYDTSTKKVSLLYEGLVYPNGVALSADNSFILVAESRAQRILKFDLGGNNVAPKVFADKLAHIPDNIKRNEKGEFWVSIGVKYDKEGKILKTLDGRRGDGGANFTVSEFNEYKGKLYMGSVTNSYVGILNSF